MKCGTRDYSVTWRCVVTILVLLVLVLVATALLSTTHCRQWIHELRIARRLTRLGADVYWGPCYSSLQGVSIKDGRMVTDDMVSALAEVNNLQWLSVHVASRKDGAIVLTRISQLPHVHRLTVLGDIGDSEVRNLTGPDNLGEIMFYLTDIGDGALEHLATFRQLRKVQVYRSKVTAEGVAELKQAIPNVRVGWDNHVLPGDM